MRISFYEEFPTAENMDRMKLLKFKPMIIVAAKSLSEYRKIEKEYKGIDLAYWPTLEMYEGYWFSAFSDYKAVKKIIDELKNEKTTPIVMWDAEPPLLKKSLFFKNLFSSCKTSRLIKDFMRESKPGQILTSELPLTGVINGFFLRLAALSFPRGYPNTRIIMGYQSFMPEDYRQRFIKKVLKRTRTGKQPWIVGLGVISKGILQTEKPLPSKELHMALTACNEAGMDEVVIYRLGGLDANYAKVINQHA